MKTTSKIEALKALAVAGLKEGGDLYDILDNALESAYYEGYGDGMREGYLMGYNAFSEKEGNNEPRNTKND